MQGHIIRHDKERRTKWTHPYSYDPILIWRAENAQATWGGTVYTDRLLQWDREKHDRLSRQHFGNESQMSWSAREPAKVEAFLRDYLGYPALRLLQIEEHCNQASGYPVWRFDYARTDAATEPTHG
jgi:hypothetical protein